MDSSTEDASFTKASDARTPGSPVLRGDFSEDEPSIFHTDQSAHIPSDKISLGISSDSSHVHNRDVSSPQHVVVQTEPKQLPVSPLSPQASYLQMCMGVRPKAIQDDKDANKRRMCFDSRGTHKIRECY